MNLLVITIAPLFPDLVQGGSQRVLMQLLPELGAACDKVTVLCSRQSGEARRFKLAPNVEVRAELPLRGAFPSPFEVPPFQLASVWRIISDHARLADRIYLHGDGIFLRRAFLDKPIVRSLHDFIYEEALVSAFQFDADRTILPSDYVRDCFMAAVAGVRDIEELRVIRNGIELPATPPKPVLPPNIRPRGKSDRLLLFPHRLDPRKGTYESLAALKVLIAMRPDTNFRLLVPAPEQSQRADDEGGTGQLLERAHSLGIGQHIEVHKWLGIGEMAAYYAAGDATLCLGSMVEAMPLVPLESAAAGTPAVCARTGPWREQSVVPGIVHVPYGDAEAAAGAVLNAIAAGRAMFERSKPVLAEKFDISKMRAGYVDAVLGNLAPRRSKPIVAVPRARRASSYRLAPWCHIEGDAVFSHHAAARVPVPPQLARLLAGADGKPLSVRSLTSAGIDAAARQRLVRTGALINHSK